MKRGRILLVILIGAVTLSLPARGDETPKSEIDVLRAEVTQLKAMVDQLTRQLHVMNERLARLEDVTPAREGKPGQSQAEKVQPKTQVPEQLERGSQLDRIQNQLKWHVPEQLERDSQLDRIKNQQQRR